MKIEVCHIYLAMNIYDTAFHILLVVVFSGRNRLIDTFSSTLYLNSLKYIRNTKKRPRKQPSAKQCMSGRKAWGWSRLPFLISKEIE